MNWRGLRWIYSNSVLVFADEFEDDLRDSFDARINISGISFKISQRLTPLGPKTQVFTFKAPVSAGILNLIVNYLDLAMEQVGYYLNL